MNPRAVAAWSAAALVIALSTSNPAYRVLVLLAALNFLVAQRRADVRLAPPLLAMAVAAVVAVLISGLFSHSGAHVLLMLPAALPGLGGAITIESLAYGVGTGLGLAAAVAAAAPLSMVAAASDLVDALPRWLSRTGAAVATAVGMIPGIARSFTAVREAQQCRGVRLGGLRGLRHILVPVTLTALEQSLQTAEAMDARAFGSGPRSNAFPSPWAMSDSVVILASLVAAGVFVAMRLAGAAPDWTAFPSLTLPPVTAAAAACVLLLIPAVVPGEPHRVVTRDLAEVPAA